jgi:hypothetical protein
MRARAFFLLLAAAALAPAIARADDDASDVEAKRACVDAHVASQLALREGRLSDARKSLATCTADVCPVAVRQACAELVAREKELEPAVQIATRTANGHDVRVPVEIDGAPHALEGPVVLDPGEHTVSARFAAGVVSTRVVVRVGERERLVILTDPAPATTAKAEVPWTPPSPQPAERAKGSLVWPIGLSALSAAAFITAIGAGVSGLNQQHQLESTCAPSCSQEAVDGMHTAYVVADVSLVVGAILGVGALGLWVWRP